MKKRIVYIVGITLFFSFILIASLPVSAHAIIVNLDGRVHGGDGDPNNLQFELFLEEGKYTSTLINPSTNPGALFTAYSPISSGSAWRTDYVIFFENPMEFINGGFAADAASPIDAFNVTPNKVLMFEVLSDQTVELIVGDTFLRDNRGGISLEINPVAVPEPATIILFSTGLAGAFIRKKQQQLSF